MPNYPTLDAFLKMPDGRAWIRFRGGRAYLRKNERWVGEQWRPTLVLANVTVDEHVRQQGRYSRFLQQLERAAARQGRSTYVENIVRDHLPLYERRGYVLDETTHPLSPSVYKIIHPESQRPQDQHDVHRIKVNWSPNDE